MPEPILYETHSHTPLCKHAVGEPSDYAAAAKERGLKGILVTCHCPLPDGISASVRMAPDQFESYVELVASTREAWAGRVDVRLGLESDYYPGVEPWLEKLHERAELHYILGSVHCQVKEYRKAYDVGNAVDYRRVYYDHLARSAESGLFDALAHPDLIKNIAPESWNFAEIRSDVERALDRIAATGVAMELNTSGLKKSYPEMNPGIDQLRLMLARGIPVVIGSDSHEPARVGAQFHEALETLKEVGYREVSFFLDRQRQSVALDAALASLPEKR